jgi:hypothetical protein
MSVDDHALDAVGREPLAASERRASVGLLATLAALAGLVVARKRRRG